MDRNIYSKLHSIKGAGIKLQRDTKAFNYRYATLSQIQDKLWELLQEQGLIVIHLIIDGKVRTEIRDIESSDLIASEIEMTPGIKPQDKGSEITYYRRYNLLSLLDLEVEDDDGKKAQDSKIEVKKELKPKFTQTEYQGFIEKIWNFQNSQEAIQKIKTKYELDSHFEQQIILAFNI